MPGADTQMLYQPWHRRQSYAPPLPGWQHAPAMLSFSHTQGPHEHDQRFGKMPLKGTA